MYACQSACHKVAFATGSRLFVSEAPDEASDDRFVSTHPALYGLLSSKKRGQLDRVVVADDLCDLAISQRSDPAVLHIEVSPVLSTATFTMEVDTGPIAVNQYTLYNRLWWDSETLTYRSKNLREIPASVCLWVGRPAIFFRGLWEPPSTQTFAPSKQWARRSEKDAH